ncbi:MAG: hypothetical protein G01um101430_313 [Parcubacteria group bacterium Gr01-1014_30]|nr:MAG: hypothetical protein G01um101430_313 [Parcubacteria group bacterium Gr01-1014_30]
MKILYVAIKYDYGKPEKGYSSHHYNFYSALAKMGGGGNDVIYFPYDEVMLKFGREEMNKNLLDTVFQQKPDLVFCLIGDDAIRKETMGEITKAGITTINWCADDHWKFYNYTKYWLPYYTWQVTTDPDMLPEYEKVGYKNVILSQWACDHFTYKPQNLPKIYDVTFVGAAHGTRKKMVEKLKKAGIEVLCWGAGWPKGRVSQEDMLKIWAQSKINLNFAKSSGVLWKELASIFLRRRYDDKIVPTNPKYWSANAKTAFASLTKNQIKGRNFEVPGCKTFFLTEYVRHLEDYYEIGREIEYFRNIPELIEKIKYYLVNEKEREFIAQAGYERTIKEHTFEKRFNEIFKIMGLSKQ